MTSSREPQIYDTMSAKGQSSQTERVAYPKTDTNIEIGSHMIYLAQYFEKHTSELIVKIDTYGDC